MSNKPIAALLTVLAVTPLCLACALGPAAIAAAAGSFLSWLALVLTAAVVAIASWFAWRAPQPGSSLRETETDQRGDSACGVAGTE